MGVPAKTRPWTLEDLHRLPEDGNKYELVYGELFVTPPPSPSHEEIGAILLRLLLPYIERWKLGRVYTPRAVVRALDSEVEPDVMVRPLGPSTEDWSKLPRPVLVVEISSKSTRRRDRGRKRQFYLDLGVPEYWIVDRETRTIQIVRSNTADVLLSDRALWQPVGAAEPFILDVQALFREALEGNR